MNILYIGPYRDGTGWSEASKRIILSLDSTDNNVVIRPIRYNKNNETIPIELRELENKPHVKYDVIIQNCLPHNFEYNAAAINIGMWWSETNSYKVNQWSNRINQLDRGIVFNDQMVDAARKSQVKIPLDVFDIPHYEPEVYSKQYQVSLDTIDLSKKYVFYNICEHNRRKNLAGLLIAFHTEFDPHEDAELIIKTDRDISGFCDKIKQELKLYKNTSYYKPEIVISNRLSEENIYGLHQLCDCFVSPSYAEGLNLPAYDAACFGNQLIVPYVVWGRELITNKAQVRLVDAREDVCFGMTDSFTDLYTAHDTWDNPNIMRLRHHMRQAFKQGKGKEQPDLKWSFEAAGRSLAELLND